MKDVILWGGTGQAKVVYDALGTNYSIVVIVDNQKLVVSPVTDTPLLYGMHELLVWLGQRPISSPLHFVVAIGGSCGRDRLSISSDLKQKGFLPLSVVHKYSFIAKTCFIGTGVQIMAMAAVCANAQLGDGVIVNTSALVDHDCVISDGVHIGPGARLAGEVVVNKYAFIGTGAVILPRIHIGEDAIVGAGAVVTKNVPSKATVVGNPAYNILCNKNKNI